MSPRLLTPHLRASDMVKQIKRCGANTVQNCDHVSVETRRAVRNDCPGVRLLQVVHMGGDVDMETVRRLAECSDGLPLILAFGTSFVERGGTGRALGEESCSRRVCDDARVAVGGFAQRTSRRLWSRLTVWRRCVLRSA